MTIYQAQPCRIYPFLFTESKENFPLLRYEFSDQFIYSNINDAKIAFSCHINNMSPEMHSLPKTLKEAEYCLFLAPPRKKNGYSISDNRTYEVIDDYIIWDWSKEIDFLYGLFSACYLENFEKYKKNTDFSFTVIDHPMKQIVNLYYLIYLYQFLIHDYLKFLLFFVYKYHPYFYINIIFYIKIHRRIYILDINKIKFIRFS